MNETTEQKALVHRLGQAARQTNEKRPKRQVEEKSRIKKPAVTQPAMKEPLKTGRVSTTSPPLLRRFPCEVPADNAISTTDAMTRPSEKSSQKVAVF